MRDLRGLLAPALALSMAAALAACGSGGSSGAGGKTKLIIATFGDFGYQDLYKEYEKLHTDIQITERVTKAEDHHKNIAAQVPGSAFFDGPTVMYRAVLGQADVGLYDSSDNVVVETNPAVRAAFNKTIEALGAGLSAKIEAFSPEWNAGFQKGGFATVACPSWMMAYIQ